MLDITLDNTWLTWALINMTAITLFTAIGGLLLLNFAASDFLRAKRTLREIDATRQALDARAKELDERENIINLIANDCAARVWPELTKKD